MRKYLFSKLHLYNWYKLLHFVRSRRLRYLQQWFRPKDTRNGYIMQRVHFKLQCLFEQWSWKMRCRIMQNRLCTGRDELYPVLQQNVRVQCL